MNYSLLSLILFAITTGLYAIIEWFAIRKKTESAPIVMTERPMLHFLTREYQWAYIISTILIQWGIAASYLQQRCQGETSMKVLGLAFKYTFLPFTLIFGLLLFALYISPSLLNITGNVVGYAVVSSEATKVIQNATSSNTNADLVSQIVSNQSLVINEFAVNGSNFWPLVTSICGVNAQNISTVGQQMAIVLRHKNLVGLIVWLFYTGILVTSLIFYQITTAPCSTAANNNVPVESPKTTITANVYPTNQ